MAEGADPDADKDRHKKASILQWLKDVEMAHSPRVPDGGLTFNPDPTSYYAHNNPIGITTANPMQAPFLCSERPRPSMHLPSESSVLTRRGANTRSQSFSLLSKPVLTSSLSRRQASQSSTEAMKTTSTVLKCSPLVSQASSHGPLVPGLLHQPAKKMEVLHKVKLSPTGVERKESSAEEHLCELRSQTNKRQTSLSPLPVPTAEPSLPTFDLSEKEFLPAKQKLKKKLPTVTGGLRARRDQTSPVGKLVRATTSPGEFSLNKVAKSAPPSPRPTRAGKTGGVGGGETSELREEKESNTLSHDLERQKSFSHNDIEQLDDVGRLGVGGVSPALSQRSHDGDAPSTQQSLAVEEGSSGDGGRCDNSCDKMESFPSDDVLPRSDDEVNPCNQSLSSAVEDRAGEFATDQSHSCQQSQPDIRFAGGKEEEDQTKVSLASMCPISPPSLSSPRAQHSPLIRQHHISRSPSPTNARSTSPFHKYPHSNSGTESRNVISKQKLKLLSENRTFSFDTSDDTDLTTLSKQPKFLLNKAMKPTPTCPLSPPPLLSPPSSRHNPATLSTFLSHHAHSRSDGTINHRTSSPTQLTDQSDLQTSGHVTNLVRLPSPVLSDHLVTRRGSTPVTLSLTKSSPIGQLSSVSDALSARRNDRGSLRSVAPPRSLLSTASKSLGMSKAVGMSAEVCLSRGFGGGGTAGDCFKERRPERGSSEVHTCSGVLDKTSVNRQDSGLGTLSTTSNKCDFRM